MKPLVDIVIPSYNSVELFKKHLRKTIENTRDYLHQVIIVDDHSIDGTKEYIEKEFKDEVIFFEHNKNLGFTKTAIEAIGKSKAEYFVLLNNDVEPHPHYLDSAIKILKSDSEILAVSFNEVGSSWPDISWHDGKFQFTRGEDKSSTQYTAWASGGSAIFRKSIYTKIGGLLPIFAPAYWEDIDLGIRAWKMGYKIVWDKDAKVSHEHEASYGKVNRKYLNHIKQRNELIFTWQNFTDSKHLKDNLKFVLLYTIAHPSYLFVVISASLRFLIFGKRVKSKLSDKQVFQKIHEPFSFN